MTNALSTITNLDLFLKQSGEDIILRRTTAGNNADQVVRASVRALRMSRVQQLVDGTTQDDKLIVFSPTEIRWSGWPNLGSMGSPPFDVDVQIPRRGDKVIVSGALFRIEVVNAIKVDNEVVRIQIMTKGGASGA